jgi:uncharacterized C2H2 Zn-finger protein
MALQEGSEVLVCQRCGAHHKARWYRLPVRDEQLVRCPDCNNPLVQGKGVKEHFESTLVRS